MKELTKYRFGMTTESLSSSNFMLANGYWKSSVSCSYFAMFNSIRALLAEGKMECKTFFAIVHHFRCDYIKTNILDKKLSAYFDTAFKLRAACDYADFFIASRGEAEEQYQHAVEFVAAVKNYLEGGELNVDD